MSLPVASCDTGSSSVSLFQAPTAETRACEARSRASRAVRGSWQLGPACEALAPDGSQLGAGGRGPDPPDRPGPRARDQRLGRGAARARVANALEHVPVSDAGG